MWYKFIQDEFELTTRKKEDLDWLYEHCLNNITRCYFTKGVVLVLRVPDRIRRNEVGFHSTENKPAIEWNRYSMNYINGRRVDNWIFEKYFSGTLTFQDFLSVDNEDMKAGIITLIKENEGNEGLLKFLSAELIDEQVITHDSGYSEKVRLYKTKDKYSFLQDRNGNMNQPYVWTEIICPSTGQSYLLDTSADFDNVIDALKFHRPSEVPFELAYNFINFNN